MTDTPQPNPWSGFSRDPRDDETDALRASDADRGHATDVLAEAYADGRLRNPEYSERLEKALQATYLRDFTPLINDLALPSALIKPEPTPVTIPWYRSPVFRGVSATAGGIVVIAVLLLLLNGAGGGVFWMIWPFMFFVLPQFLGRNGTRHTSGPHTMGGLPGPDVDTNKTPPSPPYRGHRPAGRHGHHRH